MPPSKHIPSTKARMGKGKVSNPVVGIGGSVEEWAKERLYRAAAERGISPSAYIGGVLMEHARGLPVPEVDPRQMEIEGIESI